MIFRLETQTRRGKSNPLSSLLRALVVLLALIVGAFVFTVAATAALIVGAVVSIGGLIWWQLVGKKRFAQFARHGAEFDLQGARATNTTNTRSGNVIEGELVK